MPDDINSSTHGGYLKDIPKPHRRYFSTKRRKRRVEISCAIWWGHGGNHRNVTIQEEDNPIWNSTEESWQISWDDKDGHGQTLERRFKKTEIDKMNAWIKRNLEKHFPGHRHIVKKDNNRWMYKDGD